MTAADVARLEKAIEKLGADLRGEIAEVKREVAKASNFQVGFQAISKGLTYVCLIVAALATAYGALR